MKTSEAEAKNGEKYFQFSTNFRPFPHSIIRDKNFITFLGKNEKKSLEEGFCRESLPIVAHVNS